jgi:hypothetical protein
MVRVMIRVRGTVRVRLGDLALSVKHSDLGLGFVLGFEFYLLGMGVGFLDLNLNPNLNPTLTLTLTLKLTPTLT